MLSHRFCCVLGCALLAAAFLGGCARAGANAELAAGKLRSEGERVDSRVRSWFDANDIGEAAEENRRLPDTAYCYKTLGDTTCYRYPVSGGEERLTGVQLPPPPAEVRIKQVVVQEEASLIPPPTPVRVVELPEKPAAPSNTPHELLPQSE